MTRTGRTARSARARRRPAAGRRAGRIGWVWLVLVVAVALGAGLPVWSEARESARFPVTAADLDRARTELAALEVKGRAPRTGYDRDQFGPAWADVDRNGCDTRNDVLARDLADVTFEDGTHECVVLTGTLDDPYTGDVIDFERGPNSADVQIDHVVALSDAWQKGAQQWDAETRRRFANDPANLLAVDGPANGAKGDGDAATWLPPSTGYRCAYVARQVRVKAAYGLWVTHAERDAMSRQLDACVVAR
ncbi:HNH endonuclease family protein [Cellulomonas pakistanensis]|uniref:HNH endonuclease family protein n=1 Tax=Cellulomonas pakistanensis TaxID=992287 RepID=UPI001942F9CC|nr:HNH endonuclease family protein [Cellulomonas pakistanensis]